MGLGLGPRGAWGAKPSHASYITRRWSGGSCALVARTCEVGWQWR